MKFLTVILHISRSISFPFVFVIYGMRYRLEKLVNVLSSCCIVLS